MATFAATRDHDTGTNQSSATITTGSSATMDFDARTDGAYLTVLQVSLTISAGSPSGDCTISYYASPTGASSGLDSEPFAIRRLNFTATGTKSRSIVIPHGFVRVSVANATGATVASWTITGEKITQTST